MIGPRLAPAGRHALINIAAAEASLNTRLCFNRWVSLTYGAITLDSTEIFLHSGKQTKQKQKRGTGNANHEAWLGVCGQGSGDGVCLCVCVCVFVRA